MNSSSHHHPGSVRDDLGKIAIVGGGIAGLAASCLLARAGADVDLFERSDDIRAFGAGVQISPNAAPVLQELGLSHLGDPAKRIAIRQGETDTVLAELDLERFRPDHSYRLLHRADLVSGLEHTARAAGVNIQTGRFVTAYVSGAFPHIDFEDGGTLEADLVVAADGIHSKARQLIANDPPQTTGLLAWRSVVSTPAAWQSEARVWTGDGRHLVAYPLRGGSEVNIVAIEEDNTERPEGWRHPGDPAELRAHFSAFTGEAADLLQSVQEVWQWGLYTRAVPERWDHGGVVVIGDAAHPTLPFLAQGANLALEDAALLTRVLLSDLPLARFSELRHRRVRRALREARMNALRYHMRPGPLRLAAHTGLNMASRFAPNAMLSRFDWLYDYNPMTAPLHG